MKTLLPFVLLLGTASAQAQVTNGSFEDQNGSSFYGWEWTCGLPVPLQDAPSSGGSWCAMKEPGQTQGCFPSYLFQRIPNAADGEMRTLAGWIRCVDELDNFCLGAYIGFGRVNNGAFELEELVGGVDSAWTFVSVTDTMELDAGDTAIVVLTSGMIAGPISPGGGRFDAIELSGPLGVEDPTMGELRWWLDPSANSVFISSPSAVRSITVTDAAGRTIKTGTGTSGPGTMAVPMEGLPHGLYLFTVLTTSGIAGFKVILDH